MDCKHKYREVAETGRTVIGSELDGSNSYLIPEKLYQCEKCMRIEVSTKALQDNK